MAKMIHFVCVHMCTCTCVCVYSTTLKKIIIKLQVLTTSH